MFNDYQRRRFDTYSSRGTINMSSINVVFCFLGNVLTHRIRSYSVSLLLKRLCGLVPMPSCIYSCCSSLHFVESFPVGRVVLIVLEFLNVKKGLRASSSSQRNQYYPC